MISFSVVCDYVLDSQKYVTSAPIALCLARQPLMCGVIPGLLAQGCSGCLQVVCTLSKCVCVCVSVNVVASVQHPVTPMAIHIATSITENSHIIPGGRGQTYT